MGSVNLEAECAKRRADVVEWLNNIFPDFNLPLDSSDDDLRGRLLDGFVFFGILGMIRLGRLEEMPIRDCVPEKRLEYIQSFQSFVNDNGLPHFDITDLEQGSLSPVVACLLSLRDQLNNSNRNFKSPKTLLKSRSHPANRSRIQGDNCLDDVTLESSFLTSFMSEPSTPLSYDDGHKFHEDFQLKQGRYSDLPASKISEMMKSNSLDSAPTQSLLCVVKGILDESIERKTGEIPQRVACLLKKLVQEIERRISIQAEHIRNQNRLIKARDDKYQSRIRVLETIASGANDENKMFMDQLQLIKVEKAQIEESKKLLEQDAARLMNENEASRHKISELEKDLESTKRSYENQNKLLEAKANLMKGQLEENINELEFHLAESRKRCRELEEFSKSKLQKWNHKQHTFEHIMGSQLQKLQDMKAFSMSIKNEVMYTNQRWNEELYNLGKKLKVLTNAAESYQHVLTENRKLFNEVQELKGNIRVYCRIRPFLHGENRKSTTIDYIGENGELLLANPLKQGKDIHRTFKFNKVFDSAATQEDVFSDIQPLIRSVLDGYNVCIFAYGQTGSGKTYTMTGPNSSSEKDWGVNYRALNDLFHISRNRRNTVLYEVSVQMVEIYNEQVRDLLVDDVSQKKLGVLNTAQPNGLAVPDASMHVVNSTSDVLELMQLGLANRAVGATALNERSSRSHSIVSVHCRGVELKNGTTTHSCLHLVDLAGSERVDRSEVKGDRLREAQHINKSLSALGDVIFALSQKSSHVPYRNSKLTQVLQSSLGGQAKTLMFVQINPDVKSYSETVSTLKFAERVSGVELGAAKSNRESKDVKNLMDQVASLKGIIGRKDEEIERLQLLKDMTNHSPSNASKRPISKSLKHSSSSSRLLSHLGMSLTNQNSPRLSCVKEPDLSKRAASDPGNSSDHSDKQSEAGSYQSMDDFRHHKEIIGDGGTEDYENLGFNDVDSDGRLSDISDNCFSMEEETVASMNNGFEHSLLSDHRKAVEAAKHQMNAPIQIPKPSPHKSLLTKSGRRLKETLRNSTTVLRKSSTSQPTTSAKSSSKRWQ